MNNRSTLNLNLSAYSALFVATLSLAALPASAAKISVIFDGAAAAPADKTAPVGAAAGTFFDISQPAANSSKVALSSGNSADELSVRGGFVGTKAGFSINKLILNNSNVSGPFYTTDRVPEGGKTVRLGPGGLVTTGNEYSVLGGSLVIDIGKTTQPWAVGPGLIMVFSNVVGTGTINLTSGTLNMRNATTFGGVWSVASGATVIAWNSAALGSSRANWSDPTGLVRLEGGTLRFNLHKAAFPQSVEVGAKGGTLTTTANLTATLNGRVANQAGVASAPLRVIAHGSGESTVLALAGDLSGHVGPLVLGSASAGLSVSFGPSSKLSFALGANGVVDGVDTATTALISAGGPAAATSVEFNGRFVVDLSKADMTVGNTWKLVAADKLNETYGAGFGLVDAKGGQFIKKGDQWVLADRSQVWSFDPATGVLSLSAL